MSGSNPFAPSAANGFSQPMVPSQAPLSSGIATQDQSYADIMANAKPTAVPQAQPAQGGK